MRTIVSSKGAMRGWKAPTISAPMKRKRRTITEASSRAVLACPRADLGLVDEETVHPKLEEAVQLGGEVAVSRRVGGGPELRGEEFVLGAKGPAVHDKAGSMRGAHQAGWRGERPLGGARDDQALVDADATSIGCNLGKTRWRCQVGVGAPVAGGDEVIRSTRRIKQLHERQLGHAREPLEVRYLERLDEDRRVPAGVAVALQRLDERLLHGEANAREVARMLGLGINAHRTPFTAVVHRAQQDEDLFQRRHLEHAIEARIAGPYPRDALSRPQRLQFRDREVLAEPAADRSAVDDLGRLARREFRSLGNVGRGADLVLMARHQHAVFRHDEIGLDVVGALLDRNEIGGQRVLGQIAAGAAMSDDERLRQGAAANEHERREDARLQAHAFDLFSATAARTSVLNAAWLIFSP